MDGKPNGRRKIGNVMELAFLCSVHVLVFLFVFFICYIVSNRGSLPNGVLLGWNEMTLLIFSFSFLVELMSWAWISFVSSGFTVDFVSNHGEVDEMNAELCRNYKSVSSPETRFRNVFVQHLSLNFYLSILLWPHCHIFSSNLPLQKLFQSTNSHNKYNLIDFPQLLSHFPTMTEKAN